jgi:hypothetical protein
MGNFAGCADGCRMESAEVVPVEVFADLLSQREALAEKADLLAPLIERVRAPLPACGDPERAWRSLKDDVCKARTAMKIDASPDIAAPGSLEPDTYFEIERCAMCGAVEAPQPCIGVCIRKVGEFVLREPYDALAEDVERLASRCDAVATLVGRICRVAPRDGQWRANLEYFRAEARRLAPGALHEGEAGASAPDDACHRLRIATAAGAAEWLDRSRA